MNRNLKNLLILISIGYCIASTNAQTPAKLSGTVISSKNNNDGYLYNNSSDYNGNKAINCFDGNLNTYFASDIDESGINGGTKGSRGSKGGWVGLDLGSRHIITSVKYAPRPTETGRVECGVIQGANRPDFMDAVAIGIVSESGIANQLSSLTINSTRGFRYVRFYGSLQSRLNIAELEFWGHKGNGNDTHIGQLTNLPTVNIQTVNEARVVNKVDYVNATITIVDGSYIKTDNLEIRGRGNASWGYKKQPYRIKFETSTNLFDNPAKARNWTLLSNEGDKTLIRNLMAFDISKRLDMPYTPAGRLVDLVINGDYRGTYQLCDHIDVRKGRVDIDEMTPADVNAIAITGGYMLEISAYLKDDGNWRNLGFDTNRGMPVEIKSPDYDDGRTQAQTDYIRNHINTWENAVMNNGDYQQYTDIESFCKHFLVGEFAGNTDTYWQTKIYKKRADDKIYFGPVWDFDIAFENDMRTQPINSRTPQNGNRWLYQWGGSKANNVGSLIDRLISYNNIDQRMKEIWATARDDSKITKAALTETIDNYVTEINTSQDLNFKRWDNLYNWEHMMEGRGNYANNIQILKNYILARMDWMDKKLNYASNEPPGPTDNLAKNKPIESSSTNDIDPASNAVDGDKNSRWESRHGEDDKTLTIDLQKTFKLTEIVLLWETAYASEFNIEVSIDKEDWITIQSTISGNNGEQRISVNEVDARYVRINCIKRQTAWGFSLFEIEVYGKSATPPTGDLSVSTIREISLLPNPVKDILHIQSGTAISDLILSDLNGRKLLELNGDVNSIDMSAYSTGMYLLVIKTTNGEIVVKKIIKQ